MIKYSENNFIPGRFVDRWLLTKDKSQNMSNRCIDRWMDISIDREIHRNIDTWIDT